MSEISLYKYGGDGRVLSKSLINPLTKTVNIRTDIDIYNPIMLLQDFDLAYNYMLWDNRYYFINHARYTASNVWQLQCQIDVLMTYKDEILQSSATLISCVDNNNYLSTTSLPLTSKPSFKQITFPNRPFTINSNNYVLSAMGGRTE